MKIYTLPVESLKGFSLEIRVIKLLWTQQFKKYLSYSFVGQKPNMVSLGYKQASHEQQLTSSGPEKEKTPKDPPKLILDC